MPCLRDVSYFLVNSVDTELRRRHERELLAFYTWIAISVTAAASGLQERQIVHRAARRTVAALLDLESFAALDSLRV